MGPSWDNPESDPLAVLHLNNRLCMIHQILKAFIFVMNSHGNVSQNYLDFVCFFSGFVNCQGLKCRRQTVVLVVNSRLLRLLRLFVAIWQLLVLLLLSRRVSCNPFLGIISHCQFFQALKMQYSGDLNNIWYSDHGDLFNRWMVYCSDAQQHG